MLLNPPLNQFIETFYPIWKGNPSCCKAVMKGMAPTCAFDQVLDMATYLDRVAPSTLTLTFPTGEEVEISSANLKTYRFVGNKFFLELAGDVEERKYLL